jgi:hypothetical protein
MLIEPEKQIEHKLTTQKARVYIAKIFHEKNLKIFTQKMKMKNFNHKRPFKFTA